MSGKKLHKRSTCWDKELNVYTGKMIAEELALLLLSNRRSIVDYEKAVPEIAEILLPIRGYLHIVLLEIISCSDTRKTGPFCVDGLQVILSLSSTIGLLAKLARKCLKRKELPGQIRKEWGSSPRPD